ncbi:hypothetical protein [Candidatus Macondimonas diazotrophica]|jgi:hypothetical protein|uniref:Tail assembly chaperone n=1 Tax=Candidatus Macondimonas diazotrophica TaxID=2305248 RepID=A0A4Z0F7S1_9GAMM|nr:hypothetical protein [Candidatus Macondimonas diazotrophica]TFZ81587.1 hypothetical protein E4680_11840 [Candidatus Macondimonas diazotrophica]
MSLYDTYATNKAAETEGTWVEFGPNLRLKLRRFSCPQAKAVRTRLEKPYTGLLRSGGSIPDEDLENITERVIAEAIIVDWEGATGPDGEPLECTTETKLKVLKDLPDFRNQVAAVALDRDTFKAALDEGSVKN